MAIDTGHGATLTVSGGGSNNAWSPTIKAIRGMTWEAAEVDTTDLSTASFSTVMPGDLINPGEFEVDILVNNAVAEPTVGAAAETFKITYPLSTTPGNTAGYITGTAFIKSYKFQDFVTDEMQIATAVIRWTGTPVQTEEV